LGQRLKDYNTAKPLETFQVENFLDIVTGMMGAGVALVIAAALIVSFYPRAVEELRRGNRRAMGVDAAVAAIAWARGQPTASDCPPAAPTTCLSSDAANTRRVSRRSAILGMRFFIWARYRRRRRRRISR
jgi:hypothetical protein